MVQAQNYAKRKASEADRKKLFEEALAKFRNSDIEGVGQAPAAHILAACSPETLAPGLPRDHSSALQ